MTYDQRALIIKVFSSSLAMDDVANTSLYVPPEHREAIKHLIGERNELLAACKAYLEFLDRPPAYGQVSLSMATEISTRMRAAVARSEGRDA